jgi:hypothetical protein
MMAGSAAMQILATVGSDAWVVDRPIEVSRGLPVNDGLAPVEPVAEHRGASRDDYWVPRTAFGLCGR